ncbi:glycoside hydrolase family 3 protein [Phycicoccus ginsengisoli]
MELSSRSPDLARLALAVVQPGFVGETAPSWLLARLEQGLGGVALFGRNIVDPAQVARLTAQVHEANPAALVAVDEEGGDVTRLEHQTGSSWPGNLALGAVDDVDLTQRVGAEIGLSLVAVGIDLDYAPDADVNVEAANPVIGVRSFGSDPALVGRHTAAWVRGLQSAGVLACAKHFPGHGGTRVDSHLDVPVVDVRDPAHDPALEPFRAAVDAGVAAIMSAHIRLPVLDDRPATLVPAVMTGLLRETLGFTGLAVSDGLEMGAVARTVGLAEGAVLALVAGVDALCIGGDTAGVDTLDLVVDAVVEAVHAGRLPEERLAEAVARVAAAAAGRDALRDRADHAARGATATAHPGELGQQLAGPVRGAGREAGPGAGREAGRAAGREAAARSLRVRGEVVPSPHVPVLLVLEAATNIAVGAETPVGVVTAARRRWPEVEVRRLGTTDDVAAAARAAAQDRPLWVVVRDPHRHTWMDDAVRSVVAARPRAVVVDTGWPGWEPPAGTTHVLTQGASWAAGEAVVELLGGPDRP